MALAIINQAGGRSLADRVAAARQAAQQLSAAAEQQELDPHLRMLQARYDVNDFGEKIRKRLISRKYLDDVEGETETTITVKGVYKDKRHSHPGKEPLHLEIRGKEQQNITRVFRKFDEVIEEITAKMMRANGGGFGGKKM